MSPGASGLALGPAVYGAVSGRHGGFFSLGGEVAWRRRLIGPVGVELGLFAGGGGGGAVPAGSGLMLQAARRPRLGSRRRRGRPVDLEGALVGRAGRQQPGRPGRQRQQRLPLRPGRAPRPADARRRPRRARLRSRPVRRRRLPHASRQDAQRRLAACRDRSASSAFVPSTPSAATPSGAWKRTAPGAAASAATPNTWALSASKAKRSATC